MAEIPPVDKLMQQITDEYESLSRQLKVIAKYIEQHKSSLILSRIRDIAAECEVRTSAIVRFAKRFGFSGFSEMEDVFRSKVAHPITSSAYVIRSIRASTICLCQALFIALAYKLELDIE